MDTEPYSLTIRELNFSEDDKKICSEYSFVAKSVDYICVKFKLLTYNISKYDI